MKFERQEERVTQWKDKVGEVWRSQAAWCNLELVSGGKQMNTLAWQTAVLDINPQPWTVSPWAGCSFLLRHGLRK